MAKANSIKVMSKIKARFQGTSLPMITPTTTPTQGPTMITHDMTEWVREARSTMIAEDDATKIFRDMINHGTGAAASMNALERRRLLTALDALIQGDRGYAEMIIRLGNLGVGSRANAIKALRTYATTGVKTIV